MCFFYINSLTILVCMTYENCLRNIFDNILFILYSCFFNVKVNNQLINQFSLTEFKSITNVFEQLLKIT